MTAIANVYGAFTGTVLSTVRLGWTESRPVVQIVFNLRFVTAVVLAGGIAAGAFDYSWSSTLMASATWLLTTVAIYVYNGIGDVVEDRVNGSSRPLASGRLPTSAARALVAACASAAVALTLVTPAPDLPLVLGMLALGWLYSRPSRPWKSSIAGTFAVCVGGGALTYVAGWQIAGDHLPVEAVVFAVVMSLWMGLAGSTKDLADVAGDAVAGRRTLPVLVGCHRARHVIALTVGLLVAAKVGATLVVAPDLLPAAGVLMAGGAVLIVQLLRHAAGTPGGTPYRTFMVTQYAVHVAAVLAIGLR